MASRSSSSYQDKLKALKGATLAITAPGSGTDLIVRFLSKQAGLNPDRDLTITALGTADTMTAAITQGRIDGFSLSAPAAENIVKNHGGVMLFNFAKGEVKQLDGFLFIGVVVLGVLGQAKSRRDGSLSARPATRTQRDP